MTNTLGHRFGQRVAVFGGGVAGLTAAHELAERGFSVDLYERHQVLGGKVRSFGEPGTGVDGRPDLPRTMGGHFFIFGYHNLDDTLRRIPLPGGGMFKDRVSSKNGFLWAFDDGSFAEASVPASGGPIKNLLAYARLGVAVLSRSASLRDLIQISVKSLALVTSGERRVWEDLEHTSLGEYFGTERLSQTARDFIEFSDWLSGDRGANTRFAAKYVETVMSALLTRRPRDEWRFLRVVEGPEGEAWIEPWATHLQSLGVRFHLQSTLQELKISDNRIVGAQVRDIDGSVSDVSADWYVVAVPADKAAPLMSDRLVAQDPALGRIGNIRHAPMGGAQIFLKHPVPELHSMFFSSRAAELGCEVLSTFWSRPADEYGDGTVRAAVSVQLCHKAFTTEPGRLYGKPLQECSREEFFAELVNLLRTELPDGQRLFADEAIHSWYPYPGMLETADGTWIVDEGMWAYDPSSWENQPSQETQIDNLLLAGSYTRTMLNGECMDSANESGKRAAAAIVHKSGSRAPTVSIVERKSIPGIRWLRRWDDARFGAGKRNIFDIIAPHFPREIARTSAELR